MSDTDIATEGNAELRGGEVEGDIVGKGCRPLSGLGGDDGLDDETALALLPLRPTVLRDALLERGVHRREVGRRHFADTSLRSSADLDHPRRDIVRKSPSPPPPPAPLGPLIDSMACYMCGIVVFSWILEASRVGQGPS